MTATRLNTKGLHERVAHLEDRSKTHDAMAEQVKELYEAWTKAKAILGAISWFRVTVVGGGFATLGAIAVILTIYEKVRALF